LEYPTSAETDAIIAHARQALADFLGATSDEIVFGPMQHARVSRVASPGSLLARGDEVVVTELDHHANVGPCRPWRGSAAARFASCRWTSRRRP